MLEKITMARNNKIKPIIIKILFSLENPFFCVVALGLVVMLADKAIEIQ